MKAEITTIASMMDNDADYVIPQFQRAYAWTKDDQWSPLWDDIVNVAEAVGAASNSADVTPHFMGPLVVQKRPTSNHGDSPGFIVVDGQQRMTTMLVLLKAVGDAAEEHQMHDLAAKFHARLWNDLEYGTKRPKVRPVNRYDSIALRAILSGMPSTDYEGSIVECYDFFNTEAELYMRGADSRKRCENLLIALETKMETAVLELDPQEQPNVVFETLNARGAALKQFELVKSTIMYEGGVVEDEERSATLWNTDFDDGYWYDEVSGDSKLDLFLSDWLTARLGRRVATGRNSAEFRALLQREKERGHNVRYLTDRLNRAAKIYREVDNHKFAETKPSSERLLTLGFRAIMPLILWLWDPDNEVGRRDGQSVLRVVESYFVRGMLMDLNLRGAQAMNLTVGLTHQLKVAGENAQSHRKAAVEALNQIEGDRKWPSDEEIKAKLTDNPHGLQPRRLDVILAALENRLRLDNGLNPLDFKPNRVLLMPRDENLWSLGYDWPPSSGRVTVARKERRKERIERLGNLALSRGSVSKAAQEGHWKEKLAALENHRALELTRMLLENPGDEWSEDAIGGRSAQLADLFIRTWPHPWD